MEELISVIVPIYKVEPYLRRCVDSILGQTYRKIEVILVDDGSPDGCPSICDEYATLDSRIKVIHKQNGGLSDARNAGIDIAKGAWLAFVDSDDWIEPDMFEVLLHNAQESNSEISVGSVYDESLINGVLTVTKTTYHSTKSKEVLLSAEAIKQFFFKDWAAWDKIYRRELFENIRYPIGEINEDEAIALLLLDQCSSVVYTNRIVYHYFNRPQSITTAEFSEKKFDWYCHCKQNLAWIKQHYPELEKYAVKRLISSILWTLQQIALSEQTFPNIVLKLKEDICTNYAVYRHCELNRSCRFRLIALRWLPFWVYQKIEQNLCAHNIRRTKP